MQPGGKEVKLPYHVRKQLAVNPTPTMNHKEQVVRFCGQEVSMTLPWKCV